MSIKKLSLILVLVALLPASVAFAGKSGPPPSPTVTTTSVAGSNTDTVNRGYAGLKWTLGEGLTPAVVVGYRHARVESNGDTQGGDVSFSFNLLNGFQPGKLRAKYFNGQENLQGEVGAGFDFTKGIFAGVSAQGPYINLGADYLFNLAAPFEPYLMLNTLRKYDKPRGGSTTTTKSCPSPYEYDSGSDQCVTVP